jgi:hypothetical protein
VEGAVAPAVPSARVDGPDLFIEGRFGVAKVLLAAVTM